MRESHQGICDAPVSRQTIFKSGCFSMTPPQRYTIRQIIDSIVRPTMCEKKKFSAKRSCPIEPSLVSWKMIGVFVFSSASKIGSKYGSHHSLPAIGVALTLSAWLPSARERSRSLIASFRSCSGIMPAHIRRPCWCAGRPGRLGGVWVQLIFRGPRGGGGELGIVDEQEHVERGGIGREHGHVDAIEVHILHAALRRQIARLDPLELLRLLASELRADEYAVADKRSAPLVIFRR